MIPDLKYELPISVFLFFLDAHPTPVVVCTTPSLLMDGKYSCFTQFLVYSKRPNTSFFFVGCVVVWRSLLCRWCYNCCPCWSSWWRCSCLWMLVWTVLFCSLACLLHCLVLNLFNICGHLWLSWFFIVGCACLCCCFWWKTPISDYTSSNRIQQRIAKMKIIPLFHKWWSSLGFRMWWCYLSSARSVVIGTCLFFVIFSYCWISDFACTSQSLYTLLLLVVGVVQFYAVQNQRFCDQNACQLCVYFLICHRLWYILYCNRKENMCNLLSW